MASDERFGETNRMVPFMGLDLVADWFGGTAAPVLVSPFEKAARIITGIADVVEGWNRRRATYRRLLALDNRLLDDIGVARGEIPVVVKQTKLTHRP